MTHRTAVIVIISLCILVLIAGGAYLLWGGSSRPANSNATDEAGLPEEASGALLFMNLEPTGSVADRIVLFGNSLIGVPTGTISSQLESTMRVPVTVDYDASLTSVDAIDALVSILQDPPQYLVLDIGRYDVEHGIDLSTTLSNVSLIVLKAKELGVTVVVIGGIRSDGDLTFAGTLRGMLGDDTLFIDATALLLDATTGGSPATLTLQGAEALATDIQKALTQ